MESDSHELVADVRKLAETLQTFLKQNLVAVSIAAIAFAIYISIPLSAGLRTQYFSEISPHNCKGDVVYSGPTPELVKENLSLCIYKNSPGARLARADLISAQIRDAWQGDISLGDDGAAERLRCNDFKSCQAIGKVLSLPGLSNANLADKHFLIYGVANLGGDFPIYKVYGYSENSRSFQLWVARNEAQLEVWLNAVNGPEKQILVFAIDARGKFRFKTEYGNAPEKLGVLQSIRSSLAQESGNPPRSLCTLAPAPNKQPRLLHVTVAVLDTAFEVRGARSAVIGRARDAKPAIVQLTDPIASATLQVDYAFIATKSHRTDDYSDIRRELSSIANVRDLHSSTTPCNVANGCVVPAIEISDADALEIPKAIVSSCNAPSPGCVRIETIKTAVNNPDIILFWGNFGIPIGRSTNIGLSHSKMNAAYVDARYDQTTAAHEVAHLLGAQHFNWEDADTMTFLDEVYGQPIRQPVASNRPIYWENSEASDTAASCGPAPCARWTATVSAGSFVPNWDRAIVFSSATKRCGQHTLGDSYAFADQLHIADHVVAAYLDKKGDVLIPARVSETEGDPTLKEGLSKNDPQPSASSGNVAKNPTDKDHQQSQLNTVGSAANTPFDGSHLPDYRFVGCQYLDTGLPTFSSADLLFAFGKDQSKITPVEAGKRSLRLNALRSALDTEGSFLILAAFADHSGTQSHNLKLALERYEHARSFVCQNDKARCDRIAACIFGEERAPGPSIGSADAERAVYGYLVEPTKSQGIANVGVSGTKPDNPKSVSPPN